MENGNYQMSLVEKLSFVRYGGTQEELRAAHILQDEIKAAGGESELMDFTVPAADIKTARVTAGGRELECVAYGLSGSLPEGGVELKLHYAPRGAEEDYCGMTSLEGYAVLLNALSFDAYKRLNEMHASAFITFSGK